MKTLVNVTIGSDFELLAFEKHSQKPRSVIGKLGGTKDMPMPLDRECFSQEDNVCAEFNIPPLPLIESSEHDWKELIDYCIETGNKILAPHKMELRPKGHAFFSNEELDNPIAQTFGCTPSYNVYERRKQMPSAKAAGNMRSAGFHLHFGFLSTPENNIVREDIEALIRLCDFYLGLAEATMGPDSTRKKIYGQPGEFRVKSIPQEEEGVFLKIVEYRSLGSQMLEFKRAIFRLALGMINAFNCGVRIHEEDYKELQECMLNPNYRRILQLKRKYPDAYKLKVNAVSAPKQPTNEQLSLVPL